MQMSVTLICSIILVLGTALLIFLERKFPYRRGIPFFRKGFWTDVIGYTLIQSFLLKILIFDYIITPIQDASAWHGLPQITAWPVWLQVLFFLITHDLYIYGFHRWQHANKILWRTHEAHHSNQEIDWISGAR
jgi:sterol desaturase/sphingolipid hydroxylase (fatty acid hydroxylase superfamily)